MTSNLTQQLIQIEDLIPETNIVATIRQDVATIAKRCHLKFQESYDDLDFLVFAILPLPQTSRVVLISHQNAPVQCIEICVRYDREDVGTAISETFKILKLTPEDLTWIDPKYAREIDITPRSGKVGKL